MNHFQDQPYYPVNLEPERFAELVFDENSKKCVSMPYRPELNAAFIVPSPKHVADGLGVFINQSSRKKFFKFTGTKVEYQSEETGWCQKTTYYKHKACPDFKRRYIQFYNSNGVCYKYSLLIYVFDGQEHDIAQKPHGNSKKSHPYSRTEANVHQEISDKVSTCTCITCTVPMCSKLVVNHFLEGTFCYMSWKVHN